MSTFGPSTKRYTSSALETASLVSGSTALTEGATLLGLLADSASITAGWVQVFDGHAAPAGGSIPIVSIRVGATSQVSLDGSVFYGVQVHSGIVVVLSSTATTYTAVSNSLFVTAFWNGV